jgi:putative phosphonate metabolism protein
LNVESVPVPRYSLYYAPRAEEGLAVAASQWLGRNAETGLSRPLKSVSSFTAERLAELTAEPRLYGFHGTLKAPMVLADGVTEGDLLTAAGNFAVGRRSVVAPSMILTCFQGFMALVPSQPSAELQDLADSCVIEFDEFRQPADEAELARRRAAGLSPRQDELLLRWGYPYVLEEWRFHLSLTGHLADEGERSAISDLLRRQFMGFIERPLQVRDLCVFRQSAPGRPFIALARFALGGGRRVTSEVWRAA